MFDADANITQSRVLCIYYQYLMSEYVNLDYVVEPF